MKQTNRLYIFLFFLIAGPFSYGQMNEYHFKRELKGATQNWRKIILPNAIFGKTKQNLNDLRVFGVTKNKDTIEAPYLLKVNSIKNTRKNIPFELLNTTKQSAGFYYTFKILTPNSFNQIQLQFGQQNFDWRVRLEGSQDQKQWFTILDDYRILSIKNKQTNFHYTKLIFPRAKFRFFRLLVKSKEQPVFRSAQISENKTVKGQRRYYSIKKRSIIENKAEKQTEISIDLGLPSRVDHIDLKVADSFDFYRPITIKYLTDSFKTKAGWLYNYDRLFSGTLNSLEKNSFNFKGTTLQKMKIIINNQNNQPLSIGSIKVSDFVNELIARFTEPATYFLVYGNKDAVKPHYDIERFTDKIPKTIKNVKLGEEVTIQQGEKSDIEPLFKNKIWLWGIMFLIIVVLAWFSWKMLRNTQGEA